MDNNSKPKYNSPGSKNIYPEETTCLHIQANCMNFMQHINFLRLHLLIIKDSNKYYVYIEK